jgi:membrane protein
VAEHPAPGVDAPHGWRGWAALVRRAFTAWSDDGASSMGAALAFYALFSLAPLLIVVLWLAGFFVGRDEAQQVLLGQLTAIVGATAAGAVQGLLDSASAPSEGWIPALIGGFTLVLGATTVFSELRTQLDRIWKAPPPRHEGVMRFVFTRFFSFLLVLGIGALLLASMGLSAFLSAAGDIFFERSKATMHAIDFAANMVVITLLFAMIYKILPSVRIAWRDVWLGAAVTAALFWVGKSLIALYLAKSGVHSGFGAAGAVVLLILWIYYSSQVFFFGAELTREFALRHGSKRDEPDAKRSDEPPGVRWARETLKKMGTGAISAGD